MFSISNSWFCSCKDSCVCGKNYLHFSCRCLTSHIGSPSVWKDGGDPGLPKESYSSGLDSPIHWWKKRRLHYSFLNDFCLVLCLLLEAKVLFLPNGGSLGYTRARARSQTMTKSCTHSACAQASQVRGSICAKWHACGAQHCEGISCTYCVADLYCECKKSYGLHVIGVCVPLSVTSGRLWQADWLPLWQMDMCVPL